jgi:hypothetical protein
LIRFELAARAAERSVQREAAGAPPAERELHRRVLGRLRAARDALDASLRSARLADLGDSARARVGASARDPLPSLPPPDEPASPLRVRRLGRPHHFWGETRADGRLPALRTSSAPQPRPWAQPGPWALGALLVLVLALTPLAGRDGRRLGPALLVPTLSLGAALLGASPAELAAALATVAAGRFLGD